MILLDSDYIADLQAKLNLVTDGFVHWTRVHIPSTFRPWWLTKTATVYRKVYAGG